MKRILLLTDDFNELTFLETLLKKIGFDCLGVQSVNQAREKALVMNPDMVILLDIIKGQSTHGILESIISYRPQMFVILIKKDLKSPTLHPSDYVNKIIKAPIDPMDLIKSICAVAGLNINTFMDKFLKLGLFKGAQSADTIRVSGKGEKTGSTIYVKGTPASKETLIIERQKRFQKELSALSKPLVHEIDRKVATKEMQEFRARENDTEIVSIDKERKGFVRALFNKKK